MDTILARISVVSTSHHNASACRWAAETTGCVAVVGYRCRHDRSPLHKSPDRGSAGPMRMTRRPAERHQVVNPATGDVVAELATGRRRPTSTPPSRPPGPRCRAGPTATPADRSAVLAKLAELVEANAERSHRRRGAPDRQTGAAGRRVRRARQRRQHRVLRRCSQRTWRARPPPSTPATTRRASGARRSASSPPSPRGTTRCRWRCGR